MKTKYNKAMKELIIQTLTNNDVTNKELCGIIGISESTFIEWTKPTSQYYNSELSELITNLKENYRENLINKLENKIELLALGTSKKTKKTKVKTDECGKLIYTEVTETIEPLPPNIRAIELLLKKYKVDYVLKDYENNNEAALTKIDETFAALNEALKNDPSI